MTYLVHGCFDWIGFHLTQKLLNKGIEVIGVDSINSEKKEHFLLSIGRNSMFQQVETWDKITKKINEVVVVQPKEEEQVNIANSDSYVLATNSCVSIKDGIKIHLPLLYGEWMPRDKQGIFYQNDYIRFCSATFKENAIYVNDFLDVLLPMIHSQTNVEQISFKSMRNKSSGDDNEDEVYIRESESMEERMKHLDFHYDRFHEIYSL